MSESSQGNAAASMASGSILGMEVSSTGVSYDLNGTVLEVVSASIFPADCDPDHPEWCWPTSALAYNFRVKMQTGEMWRLNRMPVRLEDGRVQISLRAMTGTRTTILNVPEDKLEDTIWNMGREMPPPVVVEPPVPADPDMPMPQPVENPQVPVEPPQEPTEPTEPPVEG